ncbi:Hypothetical predicted protein [Octopus vulgaris]|uniref:Uncharacterized protein n=1 Tax=Octopus vulgaris TaxID=6645 RepID=A0AA36FDH9_OCTVU|nr:Hypothetical predicted protein [Octopus vulgaris]
MEKQIQKRKEESSDWGIGVLVGGIAAALTAGALWATTSYFSDQSTMSYCEETSKRKTHITENEKVKETLITETNERKTSYSQTKETRCDVEKKPVQYSQGPGMSDLLNYLFK